MTDKTLDELLITKDAELKTALKRLDEGAEEVLYVLDGDGKLFGSLTDGDIRRWILDRGGVEGRVEEVCNTSPVTVRPGYDNESVKELMLEKKIKSLPVLNDDETIADILFWDEMFSESERHSIDSPVDLDVPVVIMAGGKGTRLDPFTRVLPKPLVPVENRTILERIVNRFGEYAIDEFYLTVNYMSGTLKAFIEDLEMDISVNYLEEEKSLGTAGGLKKLDGELQGDFFLSNCDILIDCDYSAILERHREEENDITLVTAVRHYEIPYGICKIENGGHLREIVEKPEYDFLVNTGMYVINSGVLSEIPTGEMFDINELIEEVQNGGGKIGTFPVSEESWKDVGEWDKYHSTIESFKKTD